jgi:hypothetical protein
MRCSHKVHAHRADRVRLPSACSHVASVKLSTCR